MVLKEFQILPASPVTDKKMLTLAASLESGSDHPLAKAILKIAKANGFPLLPVQNLKVFPGQGVGGLVENKAVVLGSKEFVDSCHLEIPEAFLKSAASWEKEGDTTAFCGWEGKVYGIFRFLER